jgi:hypothetical protein
MMPARAAITRAGQARRMCFCNVRRNTAYAGAGDDPPSMTCLMSGLQQGWLVGKEPFIASRTLTASPHSN